MALLEEAPPGAFRVEALVAGRDALGLAEQARRLGARLAVVADPASYGALRDGLAGSGVEAAAGPEAVAALTVVDFPAIVVIDAEGNNFYEEGQKPYRRL